MCVCGQMGKRVPFAPAACMTDGLLDLVLISSADGWDILHANALARAGTHEALPFVEVVRCRSYTLTPHAPRGAPAADEVGGGGGGGGLNLDGELAGGLLGGGGAFRATCVPSALEVYAASLNASPRISSDELEPQLVLGLMQALGRAVPS